MQDKNTLQTLLKRLATSLNPSLPIALHEATLELYEILLQQGIVTGTSQSNQDNNFISPASASFPSSRKPIPKTDPESSKS